MRHAGEEGFRAHSLSQYEAIEVIPLLIASCFKPMSPISFLGTLNEVCSFIVFLFN
tara:strand:+ start:1745 stop:1912 length:168 start_codon:yes stop_codon:yes gene_type:complete